jgi:hypothetical protein
MIVQIILTIGLFIIAGILWVLVWQIKKQNKKTAENG